MHGKPILSWQQIQQQCFEIFVPVSNLLTIQNPYLPNGAHINNSKRMLKENGASSNIKQPLTPFSDKEEQARMRLAGMIKSGLATNPMINKKCKKQIRETTTCSPEHITKGYNLHKRMIKTLLNNPNLKYLCGKSKGGKMHQSNTKHVLEKFFNVIDRERSQQKFIIYNRCVLLIVEKWKNLSTGLEYQPCTFATMIKTLISYHYHIGVNFNIDNFKVQGGATNVWEKNINRHKNNDKTGT